MSALLIATLCALGTFYLYTAIGLGWTGARLDPRVDRHARPRRFDMELWLRQAGLEEVNRQEFFAVIATLFAVGAAGAYAMFGGLFPALTTACFAASVPVASHRQRRRSRRTAAQEAWPRIIEEIRVHTSSLGRSIPQALFDVGARAPDELRPAFDAANREWLLTTDLPRTFSVLKSRLADPTADMICETLLVAHELGGADLDHRLATLATDRLLDAQGRKDARSRQAGARFARSFVLLVPGGMALAGLSIGNGREAYRTSTGQTVVVAALVLIIACWCWAGHVMRLPEPRRVFGEQR